MPSVKAKATISKYENGQIAIDILTLYDIARALGVHVEQVLYSEPESSDNLKSGDIPSFFRNLMRFYVYFFDGRNKGIIRCVIDVLSKAEDNSYKVMMYMNIYDYEHYQNCENTYWGFLRHYDVLSCLNVTNNDMPMEQVMINILAPSLDTPTKWGLFTGISARPLMPVATKVLVSKKILAETPKLVSDLHISKEDIRLLKLYNMLPVTQ
jgi:transcriptional regulator with XRE-family HTH domain